MTRARAILVRMFGYRRLYVDAILQRAPRRAVLAVVSEIARLAFVVTGSVLIALIFWLLTFAAGARGNVGLTAVFGLCAASATLIATLAAVGIGFAASDFRRVRRAATD